MLIVVLIGAIAFYVALYLLFVHLKTPLQTMDAWIRAFHALLFAPEEQIFFLLRGVIFVAIVYAVSDLFLSGWRRARARRAESTELRNAPRGLSTKKPKNS